MERDATNRNSDKIKNIFCSLLSFLPAIKEDSGSLRNIFKFDTLYKTLKYFLFSRCKCPSVCVCVLSSWKFQRPPRKQYPVGELHSVVGSRQAFSQRPELV